MFMTGCDANNPAKTRQAVIDAMESNDVTALPRDPFTFIVRTKDNAIWYIETDYAKIYAKAMIIPPTINNTNK